MKPRRLAPFLLALLPVAAVYVVGLGNGFVWLDHFEIVEGALIVDSPRELVRIWADDGNFPGYHRPVYDLLHSLDRALWGPDPLGFQLSSRLLHLLDVALVVWLALRLGLRAWPAAFLGLLFGLHPLNTAVAGLIHAKADLFSLTLVAGSLALFLGRGPGAAGRTCRALSLAAFLLALFTKESAFLFPVGATLWLLARRRAARDSSGVPRADLGRWVVGLWLVALVGLAARLLATGGGHESPAGLAERLATFATVYVDDVRRLLVPVELSIADTVTRFGALDGVSRLRALVALAFLVGLQIWLWRRLPETRKWIVLFHLSLLPVAQIVPTLHFRADRFLYVPSLAFVGAFVDSLALRLPPRRLRQAALVGLAVAGAYAARDVVRLRDFRTDETLFVPELRRRPDYLEGLSQLARAYDRGGTPERATPLYAACFSPHPDILSYFDGERTLLAYTANLLAVGRVEAVLELTDRWGGEVREPLVREELAYNRAVALHRLGRHEEALELFEPYALAHPADAGCQVLIGRSALALGRDERAREAFRRYLELEPEAPERSALEPLLGPGSPSR